MISALLALLLLADEPECPEQATTHAVALGPVIAVTVTHTTDCHAWDSPPRVALQTLDDDELTPLSVSPPLDSDDAWRLLDVRPFRCTRRCASRALCGAARGSCARSRGATSRTRARRVACSSARLDPLGRSRS